MRYSSGRTPFSVSPETTMRDRPSSWRDVRDTLTWPGFPRFARSNWRAGVREISHAMSRRGFASAVRRYVPELTADDLEPAVAGIRAQAMLRDGSLVDDFWLDSKGQHPGRSQCSLSRRDSVARDRRPHLQAGRFELSGVQCPSVVTAWPPVDHGRKGSWEPPEVASQRAQAARRPRCCRCRHRGIGLQQHPVGHIDDDVGRQQH